MLVLSRKKNETIIIDGRIKVEVLKIKGNTIRLGVSAPADVKVLRGELSPFEIDVELQTETPVTVSETPALYDVDRKSSSRFPQASEDLSRLPNPFAVVVS